MQSAYTLFGTICAVTLFCVVSCTKPESDFKKAEQAHTEQAYNEFIKKHLCMANS